MRQCNVASNMRKSSTIIGNLPNDILHRVLELMPIQDVARTSILSKRWTHIWSTQPHLVFDRHFFQYVSNKDDSAASIIHRILMQHTGPILGFHLISKIHALSQSDVDQCIIFVSKQGIQKLTLDLAKSNDGEYSLLCRIFTCSTLTHLKLSRCIFTVPDGTRFPNLVCLELKRSDVDSRGGSEDTLILPMLVTLTLRHCTGVDRVCIVAPKIETLSILSSYTVTFLCFNVNPILTSIKHLCLNGTSLEKLALHGVPERLSRPLNLRSLEICDLKISVRSISCAFCLLRNSPKLYKLDIDEVVKVDETLSQSRELLSYLSGAESHVNEALRMIRTARLRKFNGSITEMYLIKVLLAHSSKLERLTIEQCEKRNATSCKAHFLELISFHKASPKAVIRYLEPSLRTPGSPWRVLTVL